MMPELALGTAQFGLNYGITNPSGQVTQDVVSKLLLRASCLNVRFIDTAQAYGNAELVLQCSAYAEQLSLHK